MTPEEKRALLDESIKLLSNHDPFIRFMDGIAELREQAIRDACRLDVVENIGKVALLLGTVGAMTDIQDLVAEHKGETS
jgi:hypothetical protein